MSLIPQDPAGSRANLEGVNLKGAVLEGSIMAGINLRVATLKNVNMQNCDLRMAVLVGVPLNFLWTIINPQHFLWIIIFGVPPFLIGFYSLLYYVPWTTIIIQAGADLENCNLSGSDLHEANLRGANLKVNIRRKIFD